MKFSFNHLFTLCMAHLIFFYFMGKGVDLSMTTQSNAGVPYSLFGYLLALGVDYRALGGKLIVKAIYWLILPVLLPFRIIRGIYLVLFVKEVDDESEDDTSKTEA